MVLLSAVAMLGFLLAIASLSLGRIDGVAFYFAVVLVSVAIVTRLWRRERALRRADEALLPPEQRPVKRVPRKPISFPLVESVVTFLAWYVAAIVVDRVVTGATTVFTLAAIAPFAAFMLATITIAGRHMAFRLTADDEDASPSRT
jgi:hypothetical protein